MTVPLELLTSSSTSEAIWIFVVRRSRPLWRQWWYIVRGEMKEQGVNGKSLASVLSLNSGPVDGRPRYLYIGKYDRFQKFVTTEDLQCAAFCVFGMTFQKMDFSFWYVLYMRVVVIGFRNPSDDKPLLKR